MHEEEWSLRTHEADTGCHPEADGKKPVMCKLTVQEPRCSEGRDKPLMSLSDIMTAK